MYIPNAVSITENTYNLLNVIRDNASQMYRDYTMDVTDVEGLRKLGTIMMNYQPVANEFVSTLINRIAKVVITSKTYDNPWRFMKKGIIELGETVEEIFVELCNPHNYDSTAGANDIFKKYAADVRTAFHAMNFRKFYPISISAQQLKTAFLSERGLIDFIERIIETVYTSERYDEFLVMKYMLARAILNEQFYNGNNFSSSIPAGSLPSDEAGLSAFLFKAASNAMQFMSQEYNVAGVHNYTDRDNQYLICNSALLALIDVEKLAISFHMDKAEFMGHIVEVDSFAPTDTERLAKIFENDDNYTALSSTEIEYLNTVKAVIIDENFMQIYDNLLTMEENKNGVALHHNYFYHVWKTFSVSPFSNAIMFSSVDFSAEARTIDSVRLQYMNEDPIVTSPVSNGVNINNILFGGTEFSLANYKALVSGSDVPVDYDTGISVEIWNTFDNAITNFDSYVVNVMKRGQPVTNLAFEPTLRRDGRIILKGKSATWVDVDSEMLITITASNTIGLDTSIVAIRLGLAQ